MVRVQRFLIMGNDDTCPASIESPRLSARKRDRSRCADSSAVVSRIREGGAELLRSEAPGDGAPGDDVRIGLREMQDIPAHTHGDLYADLQQALAQRRHLGARVDGARRAETEFLQQDVRGSREQHAELIRPETRAARAIDLESVMQFLDPILDLAPLAIDRLVHPPRRMGKIGDDEARVVAGRASRELRLTAQRCQDGDAGLFINSPERG